MSNTESAAHMVGMTIDTITRKKTTGEPGNGGEFGRTERPEATIDLDIRTGDTFAPLTAEESRVFVEDALIQVDLELFAESDNPVSTTGNTAAGRAHAYAEIAAMALSDDIEAGGFERQAEQLIVDRKNGVEIESKDSWDGPGEIAAVKRQQIVTKCRTRSQEMTDAAEAAKDEDVRAYYFARAEVFQDAELDISSRNAYFVGEGE